MLSKSPTKYDENLFKLLEKLISTKPKAIAVDEKTPIIVSVDEVPLFFMIVIDTAKQIENNVAPHIGSIPPKRIPIAIPVKAPWPRESAKKDILLLTTIVLKIPKRGVTIKIAKKAFFIKSKESHWNGSIK